MLTKEQINYIKDACNGLAFERVVALSLAAVHRTLPVYQVYSEAHSNLQGYDLVHDGLVGAWRVLRGRPGASVEALSPRLAEAIRKSESDLAIIHGVENYGLPESLVAESISASIVGLRGFLDRSRSDSFHAVMGALEVDLVWAEGVADLEPSEGVVSWGSLEDHYRQQVRDIESLDAAEESALSRVFQEISMRAEREGMGFLDRMRRLLLIGG